jgi:hypothetical protein
MEEANMSHGKWKVGRRVLMLLAVTASVAWAAPTYTTTQVSLAPYTLGTMLIGGAHASVGGTGGPTFFGAVDGDQLNGTGSGDEGDPTEGGRVYMFDTSGLTDLGAGTATRGVGNFAMMIWDFGVQVTQVRVYPCQDHLTPSGPAVDIYGGADVIDSSLWGSNDGDHFFLLMDVTGVTPGGVNGQAPTFTFVGPSPPTTIYRNGSTERGTVNSYTYDCTLPTGYRYIGLRASTLTIHGTPDSDVEIDEVAAVIPQQSLGCTFTLGYWKNHANKWPAQATPMTLGTVSYTKQQLLSIFNTPPAGNGLIQLAHQLIAAKLNIAHGANPTTIQATIAAADALIGGLVIPPIGSGFLDPSVTSGLIDTLDTFNNGLTPNGPPHCD